MNLAYLKSPDLSFFSDAKVQLEQIISSLGSAHYANREHGERYCSGFRRFLSTK